MQQYGYQGYEPAQAVEQYPVDPGTLWMVVLASGLMKKERTTLFRGASIYWHFVDLMWLLVAGNAYIIGGKL